jgi:serine/threonine protein kinase/Tol biopolymer transport system component
MRHRDLFFAVLDLPAAERADYLDRTCGDDAELRRLVEELLRSHEEAGSFLEHPAVPRVPAGGGDSLPETHDLREGLRTPREVADAGRVPADDLSFLARSLTPGSLGRLGHYDVREVIGRGGMGLVLKAFDEKLHRIVAVKVLAPVLAVSGTARQRFVREARAAAAVSHDHVVAIHAVEDEGPIAYFVMQLIDGISLEEKVRRKGPLALAEILRIGLQTAAGLAAAHRQGLVHRDIKPANILLENGVERVKLTDFGLARAVDDASVTQSGVIAGTPLYMSPEQARGETLDHRSDLFSLGSVLYTLCTGRPAFRAGNTMAVLQRVCTEEPRPIREVNAEIPDWLCAIVARLMAKDPAARFQSAAEVADLLGRHLAHLQQPALAARPETVAIPKPRKPRHVSVLAIVLVIVLAVVIPVVLVFVGAMLSLLGWLSLRGDARGPGGPGIPVEHSSGFPAQPAPEVEPKRSNPPDALQGNVAPLPERRNPPPFTLPEGNASWMTTDRDGQLLAVPCGDQVAVFDTRTGDLRRTLTGHTGRVYCTAFSPDGRHLAAGNWDGDGPVIKIWDVGTREPPDTLRGHQNNINRLAYSPDGKRLVSASSDGTARVWDIGKDGDALTLNGHAGAVYVAVFSPDGKQVVTAGEDGTVRVWDLTNGKQLRSLEGHGQGVTILAFSPDGKLLASGTDEEWKLWDTDGFKEVRTVAGAAGWLAFAPDGKSLLAGRHNSGAPDAAHVIKRWSLDGKEMASFELKGKGGWAVYVLSPDGKTLFEVGIHTEDHTLRAYDAETGKER